jgi:hypothetical protein
MGEQHVREGTLGVLTLTEQVRQLGIFLGERSPCTIKPRAMDTMNITITEITNFLIIVSS